MTAVIGMLDGCVVAIGKGLRIVEPAETAHRRPDPVLGTGVERTVNPLLVRYAFVGFLADVAGYPRSW